MIYKLIVILTIFIILFASFAIGTGMSSSMFSTINQLKQSVQTNFALDNK